MGKNLFKKMVGSVDDEPEVTEIEGDLEEEMDAIGEASVDLVNTIFGAVKNKRGTYDIVTVKFNAEHLDAGVEMSKEDANTDSLRMAQVKVGQKYAALEVARLAKEAKS